MSSSASVPPALVDIYGRLMLKGSGTVNLAPGTYVLESSISHGNSKGVIQAKESRVTSYSITLDSANAGQIRIDNANAAINKLDKTIEYNQNDYNLINEARIAYNNLSSEEKSQVNETLLLSAESTYINKGKTYIESLINNIGTVNENSFTVISTARTAYNNATAQVKSAVTNYNILTNAEESFNAFAVNNLINSINSLPNVSTIALNDKDTIEDAITNYQSIIDLYNSLDEEQKPLITNYNKVLNGIIELNKMVIPHNIISFINALVIDEITLANSSELVLNYNLFNSLETDYKNVINATLQQKLNDAWARYEYLDSLIENYTYVFNPTVSNASTDYFTLNGTGWGTRNVRDDYTSSSYEYDGETLTSTSTMNSSGRTITFSTTYSGKAYIVAMSRKNKTAQVNISGGSINTDIDLSGVVIKEIDLTAGTTYTISRKSSDVQILYIKVLEQKNK